MPPPGFPPLLSNDPITGIPYYRHPESNTQPAAFFTRAAIISTSPPVQVAGNMLGARARAAEYHAAKAASARQQASRAELKKPPEPAPISLSAFTRNTSISRNKGVKNFVPLLLSEEEEDRSLSSLEVGSEINVFAQSPSPLAAPESVPPRAASLPPRTTSRPIIATRTEVERSIQTPHRYRDAHLVPVAPRNMYADDGYGFPPQTMPFPPHHLHYQHSHPIMLQPMMPSSNAGWFMRSDHHNTHYSYANAGYSHVPITPLAESRPSLHHLPSQSPTAHIEQRQKTLPNSTPRHSQKQTPKLGGSKLYVFGPDDVTPTKIEAKHVAREKYFVEQASIVPTPTTDQHEEEISPRTQAPVVRRRASNLKDLLIDHESLALLRNRTNTIDSASLPRYDGATTAPHLSDRAEAAWPYLGQSKVGQGGAQDLLTTPAWKLYGVTCNSAEEKVRKMPVESMKIVPQSKSSIESHPPPGFERSQTERGDFRSLDVEQITSHKFPLVDIDSPTWLEVRMPTAAERDRFRRICQEVRTSSISDKDRNPNEDVRGIPREDLTKWIENSGKEYVRRQHQIDELAGEMQRKWEYGGSFRSATTSKGEAKQHTNTVKAVGNIMAVLSMQVEDGTGFYHRGSRPYCQPPEYAIERSVRLDKDGRSSSLFESGRDTIRSAPARLARDPRFRPQFLESVKHRVDELQVPRIFTTKRVL